jgi:hypothetical protein
MATGGTYDFGISFCGSTNGLGTTVARTRDCNPLERTPTDEVGFLVEVYLPVETNLERVCIQRHIDTVVQYPGLDAANIRWAGGRHVERASGLHHPIP